MKKTWGDKARIFHILDAIHEIESYVGSATYEDFVNNSMMRSATVKQLEIIGQAVKGLSEDIRETHTQVPWKQLTSFTEILVHEYFGINYEIVWVTAKKEVSHFRSAFEKIAKLSFGNDDDEFF